MKKIFTFLLMLSCLFLVSCSNSNNTSDDLPDNTQDSGNNNDNSNSDNNNSQNNNGNQSSGSNETENNTPTESPATIYLAGDSTVKTYETEQYIAGWGQYLDLFLTSDMKVVNCAQGGRSSRSFINEGRLYNIDGCNYSFTQNNGNSIEDCIKEGDYLFIQFGHNDDDTKKQSSYTTIYDRMVPLGTPDSMGIYPTTEGTKSSTTVLPTEYSNLASSSEETSALKEIAKYGTEYYAYDCGGTYKWFLKQYIDFAREHKAIPVLITPVARVKFSGETIISGAGLHGENFAYVQAVRQLAEEENCLLIDLFADSKTMLETAGSTYANYLMALKPNDLLGSWPSGYDTTYGDATAGYTGIEATHYNKYGSFLQAAKIIEHILESNALSNQEAFKFKSMILTTPESFIDPSNLISKTKVSAIENLFTTVTVTNPNRTYKNPSDVISLISALQAKGEVTNENYLTFQTECEIIRKEYNSLNIDDRASVTNLSVLVSYEEAVEGYVEANRPVPTSVVTLSADDITTTTINSSIEVNGFTLVGTSEKSISIKTTASSFTYNGDSYSTTTAISMGGSASFGTSRYIQFTTTKKCTITIAAKSTGTDNRTLALVDSSKTSLGTFEANSSLSVTSLDINTAGTYSIGSTGSGIYVYYIIIEYFD